MLSNGLRDFAGKKVLLLQGPIGPFFYRFAKLLKKHGAKVHKINFNGGDLIFYPMNSTNYTGDFENLETYLHKFCASKNIDAIIVFNDCRPIHAIAKNVASVLNINFGVFEEGYIRPDFITFENDGVNGHSVLPKDRDFYDQIKISANIKIKKIGYTFSLMSFYAFSYWLGAFLFSWYFNNSLHHRSLSPSEMIPWVISFWRKFKYLQTEKRSKLTIKNITKRYFLVALQVHNDTQIDYHFDRGNVESFIEDVLMSFGRYGELWQYLVIKHHPMDRGYREYSSLINNLAVRYGISDRVIYIHDENLPTLLKNAIGCVVINSTVGLSALHHNCPVKVYGNSFYDIEGLAFGGSLDDFWKNVDKDSIDQELYTKFRNHLISRTQINGSFYTNVEFFNP